MKKIQADFDTESPFPSQAASLSSDKNFNLRTACIGMIKKLPVQAVLFGSHSFSIQEMPEQKSR